jgi:hypothetical protein
LTVKEKEILRQWIFDGAAYTPHWHLNATEAGCTAGGSGSRWTRDEIDSFILARRKEGMKPSPRADPYTMVRRLFLDLIGLPPTPEQADTTSE